MDYKDAIAYLKENDIRKEDGTFYEFGEVSIKDVRTPDHCTCTCRYFVTGFFVESKMFCHSIL